MARTTAGVGAPTRWHSNLRQRNNWLTWRLVRLATFQADMAGSNEAVTNRSFSDRIRFRGHPALTSSLPGYVMLQVLGLLL